jgi:putative glutamine amidotransferase
MGTSPGSRLIRMTAPLIALVAYRLGPDRVKRWSGGAYAVPDLYVDAVRRAGGVPVLLPLPLAAPPSEVMAAFDGLLLIGGGDVDPSRYGASTRHPLVYAIDPDRDEGEIGLIRWAAGARLPTLAICRGAQVMNTAFGGTLIQHLPDHSGLLDHRAAEGVTERMHSVRVAMPSRLWAAADRTSMDVASRHHQGLDRLGEDLVPVAWAEDGLVEAVEHPQGWMVGVQWHPELTAAADPVQQALFDALAREAEARPESTGRATSG